MNDRQPQYAPCGLDRCPNPHPAQPFVERERDLSPLARRIAAIQPVPEAPDRRPAWLRRGIPGRDETGRLVTS